MALLHVVNRCYCKAVNLLDLLKKGGNSKGGYGPPWPTLGSASVAGDGREGGARGGYRGGRGGFM
jgi:hypothetical protein